jgi:hypothetical protein
MQTAIVLNSATHSFLESLFSLAAHTFPLLIFIPYNWNDKLRQIPQFYVQRLIGDWHRGFAAS